MSSSSGKDIMQIALARKKKNIMEKRDKAPIIEMRKKQLYDKIQSLHEIYFADDNKFSVTKTLMRAAQFNKDPKQVKAYMNFNIKDFFDWGKFVPFLEDDYGKNYNARPVNCLNRYLKAAQEEGYLPDYVKFEAWGNKKFTVVFTIELPDVSDADAYEFQDDSEDENEEFNEHIEVIVEDASKLSLENIEKDVEKSTEC